jgi:uncharacterized protein (TIGR02246 family)
MTDEQQIAALMQTWLEATRAGDTVRVLELIAEDAVFLQAGQPAMIGRDAFAAVLSGMLEQFEIAAQQTVLDISVHGKVAHCWTELSLSITRLESGAVIRRSGHTLSVFEQRAGRWLLVRDANMLSLHTA